MKKASRQSTPGDYYRRKYEKAKRLRKELAEAIEQSLSEKEIKALRWQLELAEYVGD